MASQFSKDGRYFAQLTTSKKLTIWETSTNKVLQEFTTASPCTCLQFVQDHGKSKTSGRKKRRLSLEPSSVYLTLGTTTGDLVVYSVSKASLDFTINSEINQSVECLSWSSGSLLYSGVHQNVVTFNLDKQIVGSNWKSGKGKLTAILSIPESLHLLTASRRIKLWDTSANQNQLLKVFATNNHEVTLLRYIAPTQENPAAFFVGNTKDDRSLSVWNLNDSNKNAMAQLVLEDLPSSVSVCVEGGIVNFVAVTRSGAVQIFRQRFNGNLRKPSLKPNVTIHIASKTAAQNASVAKIPISSAVVTVDLSLHLCYGNKTFERVGLNDLSTEKVQCWIREDLRSNKKQPAVIQNGGDTMESRLQNLSLNRSHEVMQEPNVDDVLSLMVEALRTRNEETVKDIIRQSVPEDVIKKTLKKLSIEEHDTLLREIFKLTTGHTLTFGKGSVWLKHFILINATLLESKKEWKKLVKLIGDNIEERNSNNLGLLRLKGRLDLLIAQITYNQEEKTEDDNNFLMISDAQSNHYDGDSDLGIDDFQDSGEEIEWLEEEEEEVNEEEEKLESSDSSDMDTLDSDG